MLAIVIVIAIGAFCVISIPVMHVNQLDHRRKMEEMRLDDQRRFLLITEKSQRDG